MSQLLRLGFNISPSEPFWVQVREAVSQRAQELDVELIPINAEDYPPLLAEEDQMALVEELLGQDLDAIIGWEFPHAPAYQILQAGVPIIHMAEGQPWPLWPRRLPVRGMFCRDVERTPSFL